MDIIILVIASDPIGLRLPGQRLQACNRQPCPAGAWWVFAVNGLDVQELGVQQRRKAGLLSCFRDCGLRLLAFSPQLLDN